MLLKGADSEQLSRVKRVLRFMAYAVYNVRLENAFLAEELAVAVAAVDDTCVRQVCGGTIGGVRYGGWM